MIRSVIDDCIELTERRVNCVTWTNGFQNSRNGHCSPLALHVLLGHFSRIARWMPPFAMRMPNGGSPTLLRSIWKQMMNHGRIHGMNCVKTSGRPWSFEELSQRVIVNWNVDTIKLKKVVADGSDFRVIWLRDGTTSYWKSSEPNRIIRDYLRSKMNEQPADARVPTNIEISH